eukprot:SAG31_NODE_95_length_25901_cov_24.763700_16_plen_103_part_00
MEALGWFDKSLALADSDDTWAKRGDAARAQATQIARNGGSTDELSAMFEEAKRCYEEALDDNPENGMAVAGLDRLAFDHSGLQVLDTACDDLPHYSFFPSRR